jgi:hypothetical protein
MSQPHIVVIHGIRPAALNMGPVIRELSQTYTVSYFEYDWRANLETSLAALTSFIKEKEITEAHFVTHSFGSVLLRLLATTGTCQIRRVVAIAPLHQGSRLLSRLVSLKLFNRWLGKGACEFVYHQEEILKLPVPGEVGVIAGSKAFSFRRPEAYLIPLFLNMKHSDGKIFIDETKFADMKDFRLIPEYHSFLMGNPEIVAHTKTFFGTGHFNP